MSGNRIGLVAGAVIAAAIGAFVAKRVMDDNEEETRIELEYILNPKPGQRHGLFECPKCHHTWSSYFAWIGEMQSCGKCATWAVPKVLKQNPRHVDDVGSWKLHNRARCSRCQKYNALCYTVGGAVATTVDGAEDEKKEDPAKLEL